MVRFHDRKVELELDDDVVPYLNDNVQLSVEAYRDKLYEVCGEHEKRGKQCFYQIYIFYSTKWINTVRCYNMNVIYYAPRL